MIGRRQRNFETIEPQGLTDEGEAYYRAHGTLPPAISPDASAEDISRQIQQMSQYAEGLHDFDHFDQSAQITLEIGYLANVLARISVENLRG